MPIKTLLLPLRESDVSEYMLESGMRAAAHFDAHLNVLYVHPKPDDMLPYSTLGLTRGMRESITENARQSSIDQAARLNKLFHDISAGMDIPVRVRARPDCARGTNWIEEFGVRSELVARHGHLNDLTLVPRPERSNPPPKTFERILRGTGRPVLMLPRGQVSVDYSNHVVIGWNGSAEAAQALAASRPFLRMAKHTTILISSKRQKLRPNGNDVVDYLKCHGIEARLRVVDMSHAPVGNVIMDLCIGLEASLLVVGGYSHTRLQEMLLGGVTRHLIHEANLPVLMVH